MPDITLDASQAVKQPNRGSHSGVSADSDSDGNSFFISSGEI